VRRGGGGAASVSALIGIPLVGSLFMLELAGRRRIPLTAPRAAAMLSGGCAGWGVNALLHLELIRLVVPRVAPADFLAAAAATLCIGVAAGALTALTGEAIYGTRGWRGQPLSRLLLGGGLLLGLALLRAASTSAAVLAGACGGVFVPFLAIGDLMGRVFAEPFGLSADLAGAAGAAAGIAGGYRLPLTAVAMVLGVGGPQGGQLTCLATVIVAALAGLVTARLALALSRALRGGGLLGGEHNTITRQR
jgi:CIC family chloride channel protein